jgi:hypothetical protein
MRVWISVPVVSQYGSAMTCPPKACPAIKPAFTIRNRSARAISDWPLTSRIESPLLLRMRRSTIRRIVGTMARRVWMTLVSGAIALMTVSVADASAASLHRLTPAVKRELSDLYRAPSRTAAGGRPRGHISIIGGEAVDQGHMSYAAFILWFDADGNPQYACSGTVIAPNVVLTAAHCLFDEATSEPLAADGYRVVTGAADWTDESVRQISHVTRVVTNPGFDPYGEPDSDIADAGLLVLQEPTSAPAVRVVHSPSRR